MFHLTSQKFKLFDVYYWSESSYWDEGCTRCVLFILNSFYRNQLIKVISIWWPHMITNKKLYEITGTKPLPIEIAERWKLHGHKLWLLLDYPARKAMRYYFEKRTTQRFKGSNIVITINNNMKRTKENIHHFQ